MRVLLIALALLFTASCSAQDNPEFDYVCQEVERMYEGATCDGLEAPVIVVSRILPPFFNGAYILGEPYVFVDPDGPYPEKSTIHEVVHYVLHQLGLVEDDYLCEHEYVARKIAKQEVPWRQYYPGCKDYRVGE